MTTSNIPDLGYRDGPSDFQVTKKSASTVDTFSGAAVGPVSFASNTAIDTADAGTITFA